MVKRQDMPLDYHATVEEQLPLEAILSQSTPKKIPPKKLPLKQKNTPLKQKNVPPKQKTPPKQKQKKNHIVLPQKEPSTIDKYLKVLEKRPMNIRQLADKFINCPKHGDFVLAPVLDGLHDGFYTDRIFYDSVLGWMSNDWLDGTNLHWWGMHLYQLVQNHSKDDNKCGILNPSWIDSRLCHDEDGDNVVKHIQSTLRVQKDKTIFVAPYLQSGHWVLFVICPLMKTGYILDSLNKSLDKKPSIYSLIPLVEAACHDLSSSSVDWTWNMVKWKSIPPSPPAADEDVHIILIVDEVVEDLFVEAHVAYEKEDKSAHNGSKRGFLLLREPGSRCSLLMVGLTGFILIIIDEGVKFFPGYDLVIFLDTMIIVIMYHHWRRVVSWIFLVVDTAQYYGDSLRPHDV
ncbi:hypothetical protein CTI12_AA103900 [Artemisia annua]|uniref:Ulp1 protease family, C-terminal catalytic domain-containing protein n=1 Tax=Artemisia annua TaxID=35608 RepID=A0A2U1PDZ7_ARTAN|nr:hypothetical protein CTI12_AA103900 [Artemisia annua]